MSLLVALFLGGAVTLCGRESLRVARLGAGLGAAPGLLVSVCVAGLVSSALALCLAEILTGGMTAAMRLYAAIGLLAVLLVQMLFWRAPPQPKEPTRSFSAILIVLCVSQWFDVARVVLLALVLLGSPALPVAIGVGLGSTAVMVLACFYGARWEQALPLNALRCAASVAAVAAAVALWTGFLP